MRLLNKHIYFLILVMTALLSTSCASSNFQIEHLQAENYNFKVSPPIVGKIKNETHAKTVYGPQLTDSLQEKINESEVLSTKDAPPPTQFEVKLEIIGYFFKPYPSNTDKNLRTVALPFAFIGDVFQTIFGLGRLGEAVVSPSTETVGGYLTNSKSSTMTGDLLSFKSEEVSVVMTLSKEDTFIGSQVFSITLEKNIYKKRNYRHTYTDESEIKEIITKDSNDDVQIKYQVNNQIFNTREDARNYIKEMSELGGFDYEFQSIDIINQNIVKTLEKEVGKAQEVMRTGQSGNGKTQGTK